MLKQALKIVSTHSQCFSMSYHRQVLKNCAIFTEVLNLRKRTSEEFLSPVITKGTNKYRDRQSVPD
jgi:hypothetical protein